ncbi:hypothetical protein Pmar_PMAR000442 [Perkinsus marinus ATCC 50983]|uniref:Uncharacterized protein n=1 Tax=Perkinsus marinus (strain ATCC 50983 / TXsc) TaxID=423536 RepID=C5L4G4_PERM5|nr:hypothetical protein Pmar_PMAR000442 [Perkinsus marinus ATCC 50983]EER08401.1 hypothetical protein Pmar_PMAR000442 [Perkinsus marinus ATCC 50983]|eukprot:XP_002776585.1 hypothetical protein Pmar_PMAR000442 [Perkinsus marinus ATCC 50983]
MPRGSTSDEPLDGPDVTAAFSKAIAHTLAASDSVDSLGSLEDEMKAAELRRLSSKCPADLEHDIAEFLARSATESSSLARRFRRNCQALEKAHSKWGDRFGKVQDDRKRVAERYNTEKDENEKGLPWLKIPDLPKRVTRDVDGVTRKYAKAPHLSKLLKTQYVAEAMKEFIQPARRARELRRASAERCLEEMDGDGGWSKTPPATTRDACPFRWDEATEKRFIRSNLP